MIRNAFARTVGRLRSLLQDAYEDERGDVPGWVLISNLQLGVCNV